MDTLKIKERILESKKVNISEILNKCIEFFKKSWWQGSIFLLLNIGGCFILMLAFYVPMIFIGILNSFDSGNIDEVNPMIAILTFLLLLVVIVLMLTFSMGLLAGLYGVYDKEDTGKDSEKADYFYFLKGKYFMKTLKIALMQFALILLSFLLCFLPIIYIAVPLSYIPVVYYFHPDLEEKDIIKLSFTIGNKYWVETFILRLLAGLISYVGFFACGVGMLFTFAFVLLPQFMIYKEIMRDTVKKEIDEIGVLED